MTVTGKARGADSKLRVALCTRNAANPVIQLLARHLTSLGHEIAVITDPRQLEDDAAFDVAFWRADSRTAQVAAFAKQAAVILEGLGTAFLNSLASTERASNKFVSHVLFHQRRLPTPDTWLGPQRWDTSLSIPEGPKIVKPIYGKRARGVGFFSTLAEALDQGRACGEPFLLQEPIRWRHQYRVVATPRGTVRVWRQTNSESSRPTIRRFDTSDPQPVNDAPRVVLDLAVEMVKSVGGDLMRADILADDEGGVWALEVNSSFGFPHEDERVLEAFATEFDRAAAR